MRQVTRDTCQTLRRGSALPHPETKASGQEYPGSVVTIEGYILATKSATGSGHFYARLTPASEMLGKKS